VCNLNLQTSCFAIALSRLGQGVKFRSAGSNSRRWKCRKCWKEQELGRNLEGNSEGTKGHRGWKSEVLGTGNARDSPVSKGGKHRVMSGSVHAPLDRLHSGLLPLQSSCLQRLPSDFSRPYDTLRTSPGLTTVTVSSRPYLFPLSVGSPTSPHTPQTDHGTTSYDTRQPLFPHHRHICHSFQSPLSFSPVRWLSDKPPHTPNGPRDD
jgi:hypothetical protein